MTAATSPNPAAQRWDPDTYKRNAAFVPALGRPLIELLAPQAGERVLDLGCGDGVLTAELAALGVAVVGVDGSAEQVAAAKARGLEAQVADGQALAFPAVFDAVLSNAALHWMKDADAVIDGVWRALKPGGRFVAEMGGAGNVQHIVTALVEALDRRGLDGAAAVPWFFPTPEDYRARLERRGFTVRRMEHFQRPTPLAGDVAGWLETFAESFTRQLPADERAHYIGEVSAALRPHLCDAEGRWTADYVRLRFAAAKPGAAA
jgi:trans-aconitate methyltransferase